MCGICGFFDPEQQLHLDARGLAEMTAALHRRGPDETGQHFQPGLGLAIARLSIVDVQEGHQPYYNEDRSLVAVFNGEIYNSPELREGLLSRGHRLNSGADGEVIVHLYEEMGAAFVERLNGMFAIALYDTRTGNYLVVRDRLGIKPLYYARKGKALVFASQPAALFRSGIVRPRVDLIGLDQYLLFEYLPNPRSIFEDVHKLPPAHRLDAQGVKRYWSPAAQTRQRSEADWLDELDARLNDSVRRQLISDVPLGMFLSGGLDSSTVTAIAQKGRQAPFKTFSIGFQEASFDESRGAAEVSRQLGCEHHSRQLHSQDARELLRELLQTLDEPLADPAIVPTFLLSKLAREHVTVVLSGEGADELFGGYPTYLAHQLVPLANAGGPLVRGARKLLSWVPASTGYMSWEFKAKRFLAHVDDHQHGGLLRHQLWMGAAGPELRRQLYTPVMQEALGQRDGFEPLRELRLDRAPEGWQRFAWQDLQFYLAEGLLVKLDRATMATSLEGRVPYLDHTLVEFVLSMPAHLKLRQGKDKWSLRQVAARHLPPAVAQRRKKGFGLPLTRWLKEELRGDVEDALAFLPTTRLFQAAPLQRLWEEHRGGRADHRKELWTLLVLAQWWQRWL